MSQLANRVKVVDLTDVERFPWQEIDEEYLLATAAAAGWVVRGSSSNGGRLVRTDQIVEVVLYDAAVATSGEGWAGGWPWGGRGATYTRRVHSVYEIAIVATEEQARVSQAVRSH